MSFPSFRLSLSAPLSCYLLLLFLQKTSAASEPIAALDLCNLNTTDFVANTNVTWGQVLNLTIRDLGGSSYLRPDVGGALLPWVYTIIVIIVHIPVVVVRVVRWQMVQTWSLAATVLTLVVTAQGFKSTGFAPEMVLTWTPILLVIDAGSMAQILFLIIEDRHFFRRFGRYFRARWLTRRDEEGTLLSYRPPEPSPYFGRGGYDYMKTNSVHVEEDMMMDQLPTMVHDPIMGRNPNFARSPMMAQNFMMAHDLLPGESPMLPRSPRTGQRPMMDQETILPQIGTAEDTSWKNKPIWKDNAFYVAILSFLLFTAVITLQCLGLAKALQGAKGPLPLASSCSPVFQPFGLTVIDGNCNIYNVEQNYLRGVGCVLMPGSRQMSWLKATVAATGLALVGETIDVVLLTMVHTKTRWRGIKMRRPWCSMIGGLAVLGLLLVSGIEYASNLPPEISQRVWVVQDADEPSVWATELVGAGLRGALIGWNDGIFNSWSVPYYGPSILP